MAALNDSSRWEVGRNSAVSANGIRALQKAVAYLRDPKTGIAGLPTVSKASPTYFSIADPPTIFPAS
jgi:hypothetical protein